MKNKAIVITAVLLGISIGNYLWIVSGDNSVRGIEFLSIFVIGVLTGILLAQIVREISSRNKNEWQK